MNDRIKDFYDDYLNPRCWYRARRIRDGISCFFKPRQRWLTKQIPRKWCDKVELIPKLLFAVLIDFVENEDHAWNCDYSQDLANGFISQEYVDAHKQTADELLAVYSYVKNERPKMLEALDNSYPKRLNESDDWDSSFIRLENGMLQMKSCEELYGKPYEEAYAEVHRYEELIEKKDSWAMQKIVEHRNSLWT